MYKGSSLVLPVKIIILVKASFFLDKSSINALEMFLKNANDLGKQRILNQYIRALCYDYVVFGNLEAKKQYENLKN